MKKKAVLLVSGGADSATVLAIASKEGYEIHALSLDYGQKNKIELEKTISLLKNYDVKSHKILPIYLATLEGSTLTNIHVPVEKYSDNENMPTTIASSYVPARNTIFLSLALAFAETIGANDIFIGVHQSDSGNYPDCTPLFLKAFENLANIGTSASITGNKINIHAPLINLDKAQVIAKGIELSVDYTNTVSCYDPSPDGLACGECLSCHIRLKAFRKNNIKDPAPYKAKNRETWVYKN